MPARPYIIGLTGGIASGKSSVCRRLEGQGASVVDCDKLGTAPLHISYLMTIGVSTTSLMEHLKWRLAFTKML